mmetsp:Transcript_57400/g.159763  ORF Transcript_57400/g.159763 Transcript_57400/m.159763 type:complete len:210 (-) Transcript_57400:1034-1663(-)
MRKNRWRKRNRNPLGRCSATCCSPRPCASSVWSSCGFRSAAPEAQPRRTRKSHLGVSASTRCGLTWSSESGPGAGWRPGTLSARTSRRWSGQGTSSCTCQWQGPASGREAARPKRVCVKHLGTSATSTSTIRSCSWYFAPCGRSRHCVSTRRSLRCVRAAARCCPAPPPCRTSARASPRRGAGSCTSRSTARRRRRGCSSWRTGAGGRT